MRDINRIDPFLHELGLIWKTKCPDWRFGQLMFNIQRVMQTHNMDIFYLEEDQLLDYIRDWIDYHNEEEELDKEVINYMLRKNKEE